MSPNFEISINGDALVSCASVGWVAGSFTRRNQAPDSFTFSRAQDAGHSTHEISSGDKVVVWLNGQRFFTGTAQDPTFNEDASTQVKQIELLGPWWNLSQLTFVVTAYNLSTEGIGIAPTLDSAVTVTTGGGLAQVWNPLLNSGLGGWEIDSVISRTYKWGRLRFTDTGSAPQIIDVAGATSAHGQLCGAYTSAGTPVVLPVQAELRKVLLIGLFNNDALGLPRPVQLEDAVDFAAALGASIYRSGIIYTDRKITELITELLMIMPDVVCYFDYSTEIPRMLFRVGSSYNDSTYYRGTAPLASYSLVAVNSMVPRGVVIRYEVQNTLVAGSYAPRWRQVIYLDKWPYDTLMHDPSVIVHTVPYTAGDYIPLGLARSIYEPLSVLRATGSVVFRGLTQAQAIAMRPGNTLNIANVPEDLASAQVLIQECTWTFATDTVTARAGYPRHIGLSNLTDTRTFLIRVLTGRVDL